MKSVKTVLIAQRMSDFTDVFTQWVRNGGYQVVCCSGPSEHGRDCWAQQYKDCPLWSQADLVIYDPWIATTYNGGGMLALQRQRHPRMPVLFWGTGAIPKDVAALEAEGEAEFLPLDINPVQLLAAIERLIGPPEKNVIPWTPRSAQEGLPSRRPA